MRAEYTIVYDMEGNEVGKKEVKYKVLAANRHGYVVNGTGLYSIREFEQIQEAAKKLPELD